MQKGRGWAKFEKGGGGVDKIEGEGFHKIEWVRTPLPTMIKG